jgi:hypothetical protein
MDQKVKVLIYVGAAVTANCIPCMRNIYEMAREAGVTDSEVATAVRLGRTVRSGAAEKWDKEVDSLLCGGGQTGGTESAAACGC